MAYYKMTAVVSDPQLENFKNAPIFDNGAAFLSNYDIYPPIITKNLLSQIWIIRQLSADLASNLILKKSAKSSRSCLMTE